MKSKNFINTFITFSSFFIAAFVNPAISSESPSPVKKITTVAVNKITRLTPPIGFKTEVTQESNRQISSHCDSSFNIAPYTQAMNFTSKYEGSDSSRSQLNKEANEAYLAQIKSISLFETKIVWAIDNYMQTGNTKELSCSIDLLYDWAENQALLTHDRNSTGAATRKWTLGSIASAYMRLKFSESNPLAPYQDKTNTIEEWFLKLANRVSNQDAELNYYYRVNNHAAWAANAVMAVAVILDNRDLYNSSTRVFKDLIRTIDQNGMLPSELVRETRALQYHAFSMLPLFSLAATMRENNYYFTSKEVASMNALTNTVFSDFYGNTQFIANSVGKDQNLEGLSENTKLAWLPSYCYVQTCSETMRQKLSNNSLLKTTRLGGPVLSFYQK